MPGKQDNIEHWKKVLKDAKDKKLSIREIARQEGVTEQTVYRYRNVTGIEILKMHRYQVGDEEYWKKVLTEARENFMSCTEVAKEQGVSRQFIYDRLHEYGMSLENSSGHRRVNLHYWTEILTRANEEGLSLRDVADKEYINVKGVVYWEDATGIRLKRRERTSRKWDKQCKIIVSERLTVRQAADRFCTGSLWEVKKACEIRNIRFDRSGKLITE